MPSFASTGAGTMARTECPDRSPAVMATPPPRVMIFVTVPMVNAAKSCKGNVRRPILTDPIMNGFPFPVCTMGEQHGYPQCDGYADFLEQAIASLPKIICGGTDPGRLQNRLADEDTKESAYRQVRLSQSPGDRGEEYRIMCPPLNDQVS